MPWPGLFVAAVVVWAHLRAAPTPRREAYAAGATLGAATFPDRTVAMLAIGGGWALLLPALVALAARWDGFAAVPDPADADAQPDSAETARGV